MNKLKGSLRTPSTVSMLLLLAAPLTPAAGQDGAAANPPEHPRLEEVVVTAQFREQSLQDTPIAITAISAEMLEARGQTELTSTAAQAPSVNLQTNTQSFGPSMAASIRGVGQYDYSPAVEPGVGLYVDDVYFATLTGSLLDLLDLDRLEIQRGPQGTLSGRNSIGGAIKLYSQKPTGSNSGSVHVAYGSRERLDMRGSYDFNITTNLDARIAAVSKRQDGYVDNIDFGCAHPPGSPLNPDTGGVMPTVPAGGDCLLKRDGNVDYQAARMQLRYRPSGAVDLLITGDYTSDDRNPPATILTYADNPNTGAVRGEAFNVPFDERFLCGRYCSYAAGLAPADPDNGIPFGATRVLNSQYEGWGLSAHATIDIGDRLQLTSISAYREYDLVFAYDGDMSPLPLNNGYTDLKFDFFSQELRLSGSSITDTVHYTIGGYYSDQESVFANVQDIRYSGLQFASLGDRVPAKTAAGFAHVAWNVAGGLTLNGGLRYTKEEKDYHFSRRFADGSPGQPQVGGLDGASGAYSESRFDYRANVQYQWTQDVMTYVQYSTGFKGGGINPRPFFPSQVQPFGPESIDAYEIGIKSDFFDRRMRVNVAAFFNEYQDIQLVLQTCPQFNPPDVPPTVVLPCAMTANAGDGEVKGIELEATLRPIDGLLLEGSLSHTDFEYTSIAPAALGGVLLTDVAPYFSDWKLSFGSQYRFDLAGGSTLTPRIDVAYQSSFYVTTTAAPYGFIPSYTVVNARLLWRAADGDLDVSAEVTNVLDRYYYVNALDTSGRGGYATANPGRPREWALSITKRF